MLYSLTAIMHVGWSPEDLQVALVVTLRLGLAMVWLLAGVRKIRHPSITIASIDRLASIKGRPAQLAAWLLPIVELILGGLLLLDWHKREAAAASALVFGLFAVLLAIAVLRGVLNNGDCGCFGASAYAATAKTQVAGRAVARNLLLASFALGLMGGDIG